MTEEPCSHFPSRHRGAVLRCSFIDFHKPRYFWRRSFTKLKPEPSQNPVTPLLGVSQDERGMWGSHSGPPRFTAAQGRGRLCPPGMRGRRRRGMQEHVTALAPNGFMLQFPGHLVACRQEVLSAQGDCPRECPLALTRGPVNGEPNRPLVLICWWEPLELGFLTCNKKLRPSLQGWRSCRQEPPCNSLGRLRQPRPSLSLPGPRGLRLAIHSGTQRFWFRFLKQSDQL